MEAPGLLELPGRFFSERWRAVVAYGHMGRTDLELPWEQTDKAD